MKIAHLADLHLGKKPSSGTIEYINARYNDYFKVFEEAVDKIIFEKPEVLIIAGDLFDRKELSPDVLARTEKQLLKLNENNIKIIVINGNHDNIHESKQHDSWLHYMNDGGIITLLDYINNDNTENTFPMVEFNGIKFYGAGYHSSETDEVLTTLSQHLQSAPDDRNIIIVHTSINKNNFIAGLVLEETIDLFAGKVLYIAGGHVHSYKSYPKENPYFFVPGALEYMDFGEYESTDIKGFILFDTETKTSQRVTVTPRKKVDIEFTTDKNSWDEYENEFLDLIGKNSDITPGSMVFITVISQYDLIPNYSTINKVLSEMGAIKFSIDVKITSEKNLKDSVAEKRSTIAETEKEIISSWEGFSHVTAQTHELLEYLKNEDNTLADDILEKFLDEYISGGNV